MALETIIFDQRPTQGDVHGCLLRGKALISSWPAHGLYSEWSLALSVPQEKRHRRGYDAPKKRPVKVLGNRLLVIAS